MEKSEPSLVPEWLRGTGGVTGGGNSLQHVTPSCIRSDAASSANHTRSRSKSAADGDSPRSFLLERSFSSSSRHNSHGNGFIKHPYSNFTRTHRDKDRDKDKSFVVDHWDHESTEPLPSRVERDMLKRSRSMVSRKHGDSFPRRAAIDLKIGVNTTHANGNGVLSGSCSQKVSFEKEFPSLGSEERQISTDIGRVSSPILSASISSFPIGNSVLVCSEGWTSALAEVPITGGSNSHLQAAHTTSAMASTVTSLNMAEALVQAPVRARQTQTPQVSAQTQRLEELAIRQSRQLIPMTPSSKSSVLGSDKSKPKALCRAGETNTSIKGGQQHSSSLLSNHPLRAGLSRPDSVKTPHVGKFLILKPGRESESSIKDSNGQHASPQLSSSKSTGSNSSNRPIEHKEIVSSEWRSSSHVQSRNDFFNLMRKKSSTGSSSLPSDSTEKDVKENASLKDESIRKDNNAASDGIESNLSSNSADIEEEEARFLRSLGWEENAEDNDGLTEEEISSFLKEYMKIKPTLRGVHSKLSTLSESHMGNYEA